MKCIDAIEGNVKSIIQRLHSVCMEDRLDDSEYIRNMKAVIDGTGEFVKNNPEIAEGPELLQQVLYQYSRDLWLKSQQPQETGSQEEKTATLAESDGEYETYYYDYLYHRGLYPR
jgi:hypothetical protein